MEKTYKITFTADYIDYKQWADEGNDYWKSKVENNTNL